MKAQTFGIKGSKALLKAIWEESQKDKKKRIGGIYKKAFLDVLAKKMNEKKDSENLETD